MENCVDIVQMNAHRVVVIKQPSSVRSPTGRPIFRIECTLAEASELQEQLKVALEKD